MSGFRALFVGAVILLASPTALAGDLPPDQTIGLDVLVDANGTVQSAQPIDPKAQELFNRVGVETARKMIFAPARRNGVGVPSETTLYLTFGFEQREGGQVAMRLKQATNGPSVAKLAKLVVPKYLQGADRAATIVVGISLLEDGSPNMDSFQPESVSMRVSSSFGEARYLDAIRASLRNSRFRLDKVDGKPVPTHVSIPYRFSGGTDDGGAGEYGQPNGRRETGRERGQRGSDSSSIVGWKAISEAPGVELPRVQFRAPEPPSQ